MVAQVLELSIAAIFALAGRGDLLAVDLPEHLEVLGPLLIIALRPYLAVVGLVSLLVLACRRFLEREHVALERPLLWAQILVVDLRDRLLHFLTLRVLWENQLPCIAGWSCDLSLLETALGRRLVELQLVVLQLGDQNFLHARELILRHCLVKHAGRMLPDLVRIGNQASWTLILDWMERRLLA